MEVEPNMNTKSERKSRTPATSPKQVRQPEVRNFQSQQNKNKHSVTPDYFKLAGGVFLTFIGAIGLIFTSPLSFLGGIIGLVSGYITDTNLFSSGVNGAKIGSLGSAYTFFLGLELTQATEQMSEEPYANWDDEQNSSLDEELYASVDEELKASLYEEPNADRDADLDTELNADRDEKLEAETKKDDELVGKTKDSRPHTKTITLEGTETFFSKPDVKSVSEDSKTTESRHFKNQDEIKVFLTKVDEVIAKDEAQAAPKEEDNVTRVKEHYIERLIGIIKNPLQPDNDFWGRLEQMAPKDIKLFVSKLSPIKEKKHSSSELDYLWGQFNSFEFEPSKRENKKNKFAMMLEALSEEQLKASFQSPDFLNLLDKDSYVEATANTLNRRQLEWFASIKKHEILKALIIKLKPDLYLLGKLVSIMPYATSEVKAALIDKLAHLPHSASFKLELTKLAEHYIATNTLATLKHYQSMPTQKVDAKPTVSKKWATVQALFKPVYTARNILVHKLEWAEEAFEAFLQNLNDSAYIIINENKIFEDLNNLPDHRIKMIAERVSSAEHKHLLTHLWHIESKTKNHRADIESRENRLKIILEHISEPELQRSIKENKFWEIFRNIQEPYCKMAAAILTPQQFETIISNATLDRHEDFATILTQINKDTLPEKKRLIQIIEAILPYTTPWFVLALERQIKNLISFDKPLCERFKMDLKQNLTASLERPDVQVKYCRDRNLDKSAISHLLIDAHEKNTSSASRPH